MEDNSVAAGAAPLKAGHTPTAKMLLRYAGLARKRKLILGENFIATLTNAAALLSCVEEVRKEERERCAEAARATATGFRQEQLTWKGPLNKESRDCCSWRHDGAKAAEMAIRSLPSPPSL